MGDFGSQKIAADLRDAIERIAVGVVNKFRPESFLAKVYDIDLNTQVARVVRSGETTANLMPVRFALDKIPNVKMIDTFAIDGEDASGDIVLVAGQTGSYFILDFFSGRPADPHARISVKDYGAVGDGVTDDTAAIQDAFDMGARVAGVRGRSIYFPPGEYVISDTLLLYGWAGIIEGAGLGNSPAYAADPGEASVIRWNGPNDRAMIRCQDYAYLTFANLRFEGDSATPPLYGLESYYIGPADGASGGAYLRVAACYFGEYVWSTQGLNQGTIINNIAFTGANGNNDEFGITDTLTVGGSRGIYIANSQSIWGRIDNVGVHSATVAGLDTAASVTVVNLTCDNNAIDVKVGIAARVTILGLWSERAVKILELAEAARVNVVGGKLLLMAGFIATPFINVPGTNSQGGVFLSGVDIEDQTGGPHPKIYMRASGGGQTNPARLVMIDCISTMTVADFDVASTPSNSLEVLLMTGSLMAHRRLRHAETFSAEGWRTNGFGEAPEIAAPGAPTTMDSVKAARWFFKDNGSGKTQFCVQFATGAVQVVATEP